VPVGADGLVDRVRAALPAGQTIGIALSGGGDSTALLHLALRAGLRVEAVTVDHRLRPESAVEAAGVAAACARLGVRHEVRVWEHGPVSGNLMDGARRARMALIAAWARDRGLAHVALGHTQDDQAETLLMGLARAAGIAGLSGMRRQWAEGDVTFHRPLLDTGRAALRDWLGAQGIGWTEDPTNDNPRFTRTRARRVLAALAPLGISAEGLAGVAGHLAQVQEALAVQVRAAAAAHVTEVAGALRVEAGLWDQPMEVQRQLLTRAVDWLSQGSYQPRAEALARFRAALAEGRTATLQGCRCLNGWILREARSLRGREAGLWDGRWQVSGAVGEVRALGAAGLRQCPDWRGLGLPRQVLEVTPGLWQGDRLIAAPAAGFGLGAATCTPSFHVALLSH
jgi:tRNA(Ile)-lysidine synthase